MSSEAEIVSEVMETKSSRRRHVSKQETLANVKDVDKVNNKEHDNFSNYLTLNFLLLY